jgi:hypothetical protein
MSSGLQPPDSSLEPVGPAAALSAKPYADGLLARSLSE